MTRANKSKRLNDDELEAVAGGVTPPSVDPAALAAQIMQSQLNAALAVATGGADPVETPMPAHTDTGVPTITGQTHTTATHTDPDVLAGHVWFASHSAGTAATPQPSDAQSDALVKSIFEPTPGQAPVNQPRRRCRRHTWPIQTRILQLSDPTNGKLSPSAFPTISMSD